MAYLLQPRGRSAALFVEMRISIAFTAVLVGSSTARPLEGQSVCELGYYEQYASGGSFMEKLKATTFYPFVAIPDAVAVGGAVPIRGG